MNSEHTPPEPGTEDGSDPGVGGDTGIDSDSGVGGGEVSIAHRLASYFRMPFASDSVPGAYAEHVVALQYGGEVLRTYDFVDVICRDRAIGWQVKATKANTPVTWKRAKIEGSEELIRASDKGDKAAVGRLGRSVINACNEHARSSMSKYGLRELRYARAIVAEGRITYFEKKLIDEDCDLLFDPEEFAWHWSQQKASVKKEQLPALHGYRDGTKWFAWHGRGENQLHFTGEKLWWPSFNLDQTGNTIPLERERKTWNALFEWLSTPGTDY